MDKILKELNTQGYYIIEDYFTNDEINEFKEEFMNILEKYKDKCQHQNSENLNMDYRLFGIENISNIVKNKITFNNYFNKIADKFTNDIQYTQGTLLTFLKPINGIEVNSGGTWHRDTHKKVFKVLIYLNDVDENNGCFQFLTNSNVNKIGYPTTISSTTTRYSNETIDNLIKTKGCQLLNMCGKAGTVILVDTSYIHRGKPIINGERLVYTNYYKNRKRSHIKNKEVWGKSYIE